MHRRIHINIGSNRGHCHALIERAVAAIASELPGRMAVSRAVETEAWGYRSDHRFLNVGVMIDAEADDSADAGHYCLGVLEKLLEVERREGSMAHRNDDGSYADRDLDIDLIAVDDVVIDSPTLTLPHHLMHRRGFVLRPMAELDPAWVHPVLGKSVAMLLSELPDNEAEDVMTGRC